MVKFPARPTNKSALMPLLRRAVEMMGAGQFQEAIALLMSEAQLVRNEPIASNTLGFMLLQRDRGLEARDWFKAALAVQPDDVKALGGLGMSYQMTRDFDNAARCYDRLIELRPNEAESWYRHGLLLSDVRRYPEALESLEKALTLDATHAQALIKRSEVLELQGDLPAAINAALTHCSAYPAQSSSWLRVADLMQRAGWIEQSLSAYDRALSLDPDNFAGLYNKALALKQGRLKREALVLAQQALRADPDSSDALLLCGSLEQALDNHGAAMACFLAVAKKGALRKYPAAIQPPKFKALMLFSPVAGNTPYEDLIKDAAFDAEIALVLPGHHYASGALESGADVVVNLVSEPDLGKEAILVAAEIVESLGKPVINDPRLIVDTDRESVARRLADVPAAIMPVTVQIGAPLLLGWLAEGNAPDFPVIVRHAGTHGGDMMELVDDVATLKAFAEDAGQENLYLTDYVDYSSPDGCFRKYRFVFVGGEILPYHLAIGDVWKVHHASTRMAEVEWMRDEEAAFLNSPEQAFGAKAMMALDEIRKRIGLDYFGIDCSLDGEGNVVVFEVNASMLIHLHNDGFEYKTPHVNRIRDAFARLLEDRATGSDANAVRRVLLG